MARQASGEERPPHAPPGGRSLAARVLERVERDRAFASAVLDTELDRHPQLDPRDRALATELVYGVLRTRSALRAELVRCMARGLLPEDPLALLHLDIAAYQILLLDRVPAHAAVDVAVTEIRRARGSRMAGFVNAVLRRLVKSGVRLDRERAALSNAPPWLATEIERAVGSDEARALLAGQRDREGERTSVRVRVGGVLPDWLKSGGPGIVSPLARLVPRTGDLRRRPGFDDGAFVIQEEGAQVVALALGARLGERVLDACAGRGQKTSLLREQVGPGAELWAADLYPEKLLALTEEFARLRLEPPRTASVDWTVGRGEVPLGFDRVLVDAPCTGTGTLRRRPEITHRLTPEDPERLGRLAAVILRAASSCARPGGRVVFAVCSVLAAECEAVVDSVLDVLEPVPFDAPEIVPVAPPGATSFRLSAARDGTDGFFLASFVRRR